LYVLRDSMCGDGDVGRGGGEPPGMELMIREWLESIVGLTSGPWGAVVSKEENGDRMVVDFFDQRSPQKFDNNEEELSATTSPVSTSPDVVVW